MRTFTQWAEEKKLELPVLVDTKTGEVATGENTKRTGLSYNYPDLYVRGQYPHKYFNPMKATADLDLEQQPKKVPSSKMPG